MCTYRKTLLKTLKPIGIKDIEFFKSFEYMLKKNKTILLKVIAWFLAVLLTATFFLLYLLKYPLPIEKSCHLSTMCMVVAIVNLILILLIRKIVKPQAQALAGALAWILMCTSLIITFYFIYF